MSKLLTSSYGYYSVRQDGDWHSYSTNRLLLSFLRRLPPLLLLHRPPRDYSPNVAASYVPKPTRGGTHRLLTGGDGSWVVYMGVCESTVSGKIVGVTESPNSYVQSKCS